MPGMSSWMLVGEVRGEDRSNLDVPVTNPVHPVDRPEVLGTGADDPSESPEPDDEIEEQNDRGEEQEVTAELHRRTDEPEGDEGHREEGEEPPRPSERLVVDKRAGGQQTPVLGREDLKNPWIVEGVGRRAPEGLLRRSACRRRLGGSRCGHRLLHRDPPSDQV